jgi:hypothetical protein
MNTFQEEILSHARGILNGGYKPSLFWENMLKEFRGKMTADLNWKELQDLIELLGFRDKPLTAETFDQEPEWVDLLRLIESRGPALGPTDVKSLPKNAGEHLAHICFLRQSGLFDEFVRFFKPLKLRSGMFPIRMFNYAVLIRKYCRQFLGDGRKYRFLEIGAGSGYMAYFLTKMGIVDTYHIVDLPEMLLNSSTALSSFLPKSRFSFFPNGGLSKMSEPESRFYFTSAQHFQNIPRGYYEVFLNFNSFMEMERNARDTYISGIYDLCATPSLFINSNRRQIKLPQRNRKEFDNHPLLYPYEPSDRVIYWGPDDVQEWTRATQFRTAPSFSILRVALIKRRSGARKIIRAAKHAYTRLKRFRRNKK